ncbi:hypothetical protein ES703_101119 [subsurface metagenome]
MKKFNIMTLITLLIIPTLILVSPILLYASSSKGSASIRLLKMSIPTYLLGPEDPNPPLWRTGVYPCPMQTNFTDIKEDRIYNVVIMENDYIYLIILPELGGRLLGAHDKSLILKSFSGDSAVNMNNKARSPSVTLSILRFFFFALNSSLTLLISFCCFSFIS